MCRLSHINRMHATCHESRRRSLGPPSKHTGSRAAPPPFPAKTAERMERVPAWPLARSPPTRTHGPASRASPGELAPAPQHPAAGRPHEMPTSAARSVASVANPLHSFPHLLPLHTTYGCASHLYICPAPPPGTFARPTHAPPRLRLLVGRCVTAPRRPHVHPRGSPAGR
ncbi:hypothetical protein B0H19DRAFT_1170519 [Mycena capillaripes]|nr:hypothetical protein B0H19DRAFT_1170519 [Mycena capillaripes]